MARHVIPDNAWRNYLCHVKRKTDHSIRVLLVMLKGYHRTDVQLHSQLEPRYELIPAWHAQWQPSRWISQYNTSREYGHRRGWWFQHEENFQFCIFYLSIIYVCAVFNWETLLVLKVEQMPFPRTPFLIVRTHSWLCAMYCIMNALLFHMLWPWMYELTLFCGRQGLEESMKVFHRAGPRTVPWGAPVGQAFPGIFVPKAY